MAKDRTAQLKSPLRLLLQFMKIGCFTFGGGWSIIAQMEQIYVKKEQILTSQELLDMTSVARSLPGIMIVNLAMLFGYHMAGALGGLVCLFGLSLPPMGVLTAVTYCYDLLRDNLWVAAAMDGVRASVVPILIAATVGMVKSAYRYAPCLLVTLLTFSLYLFWNVNCVWLVLIGVVCGFAISEFYERREGKSHGAA